MALPQEIVNIAVIQIAWFLVIIVFIVVIQREKEKQFRLMQASSQDFPKQLLYNRFLILFAILVVSQFLFFLESQWLVWNHFTGVNSFPIGSNSSYSSYFLWIPIPLITGEWMGVYLSPFIYYLGSGTATSFLYFYYDKYCCKFRMKGIPAFLNLGVVIIQGWHLYFLNPAISDFLGIVSLTAIGLVCIDLLLARKTAPHVGILLVSFVGAIIFMVVIIPYAITIPLVMSLIPDISGGLVAIFILDLVFHAVYYAIITAGVLVFLKKTRQEDLPILSKTLD